MVSTEQHEKLLADKISELNQKHEQEKEDLIEKLKILEFQLKAQEAQECFGCHNQQAAEDIWHGAFGTPCEEFRAEDRKEKKTEKLTVEDELKAVKQAHEELAIQFYSTKQQLEAQEHIEFHLRQELAIANGNFQVNNDESNVTPIFTPTNVDSKIISHLDERMAFHAKQEERVQNKQKEMENALARFRHIEDQITQENWNLRQHNEVLMGKIARLEQKFEALKNCHKTQYSASHIVDNVEQQNLDQQTVEQKKSVPASDAAVHESVEPIAVNTHNPTLLDQLGDHSNRAAEVFHNFMAFIDPADTDPAETEDGANSDSSSSDLCLEKCNSASAEGLLDTCSRDEHAVSDSALIKLSEISTLKFNE